MKLKSNKIPIILVILIIIGSFLLRIQFIQSGGISFHYDMARDAFIAEQIYKNHDFKILGPPTSIPNLYHGVLYYYLIAPFYAFGGDPKIVAFFLSFLNSLAIVPIFLLTRDFFKDNKKAILAAFFYTVSFEAAQFGPWISNPAPAMLTNACFFYGLYLMLKKNFWGLPIAAFAAVLSTQFQFFLVYLFFLLVIFKFIFKIEINTKQLFLSILLTIVGLSSFFIAIIKFHSLGNILNTFSFFSTSQQFDFRATFSDAFLSYINKFADIFINNFLPTSVFLGGILGFLILFLSFKNKFVFFCLLSSSFIYIFGGHSSNYANVGMIVPAILGLLLFLQNIYKISKILTFGLVLVIIFSNLYSILKLSPRGQLAFVIQKDMNLKNEVALINKTYELANYQQFSINTLTLPLWTNTTWAYLYQTFGQKRYGYLPFFYGRDQVGLLGDNVLPKLAEPLEKSFYIIEPLDGISTQLASNEIETENSKTKITDEFNFGSLRLQVRKPLENEKSFSR